LEEWENEKDQIFSKVFQEWTNSISYSMGMTCTFNSVGKSTGTISYSEGMKSTSNSAGKATGMLTLAVTSAAAAVSFF
jgi:hypothetical protein